MRQFLMIIALAVAATLGTFAGMSSTPTLAQSHSCCENLCLGARDPQACYNACIHDRCGPCGPQPGCKKGTVKTSAPIKR